MNEIIYTIRNDRKEKPQSFEATAEFDYLWSTVNGYGASFEITAFGGSEEEAKEVLKKELAAF